jgi:hypothetical protein
MSSQADDTIARGLFEELCAEHLADPEVSMGRMLRADGLKVRGKVFAFVARGQLVVKLPEARVAAMVAAGDGAAFGPGDRVMREWVAIGVPPDPDDPSEWRALAADARAYVDSLSPRPA